MKEALSSSLYFLFVIGFFTWSEMLEQKHIVKLANYTMPFGKYQGRPLIDLPEAYLIWFANKGGFPEGELGEYMNLALNLKTEGLESLIRPLREIGWLSQ